MFFTDLAPLIKMIVTTLATEIPIGSFCGCFIFLNRFIFFGFGFWDVYLPYQIVQYLYGWIFQYRVGCVRTLNFQVASGHEVFHPEPMGDLLQYRLFR